jgi:hypothetical protein
MREPAETAAEVRVTDKGRAMLDRAEDEAPDDFGPVVNATPTGTEPHAELQTKIREWVDDNAGSREWLSSEWARAATFAKKLPRPEEWEEVAKLDTDERFLVGVNAVVALHDNGSVRPIRAPESPDSMWGTVIPGIHEAWHPRTLDVLRLIGIKHIHLVSVESMREYFRMVRDAYNDAVHPSAAPPAPATIEPPNDNAPTPPEFAHAPDFSWIFWCGEKFTFKKGMQAESIKQLWHAWEAGGKQDGCGLSEETIGERAGSAATDFRLAHVLRGHPLLKKGVRPIGKGQFALFRLESPENPTS